jgi:hypothetical protein
MTYYDPPKSDGEVGGAVDGCAVPGNPTTVEGRILGGAAAGAT